MLIKVISGGQTGADQGGLAAALTYRILTGGVAPKDFITANGPMIQILEGTYGLEARGTYKSRTWENVEQSNGTIRCCIDFSSAGEKCTLNAIRAYRKPHIDIDLIKQPVCSKIATWIVNNNIKILNIAGNRERNTDPSIYILTFNYLCAVFGLLNKYT
jgi:hypothetical protein